MRNLAISDLGYAIAKAWIHPIGTLDLKPKKGPLCSAQATLHMYVKVISHITYHISHITYRISHIAYRTSHITSWSEEEMRGMAAHVRCTWSASFRIE